MEGGLQMTDCRSQMADAGSGSHRWTRLTAGGQARMGAEQESKM